MLITEFASLILATALINNILLVQLLGMSSLFAYSASLRQAGELSLLTALVLTGTTALSLPLQHYVLTPAGLEFTRLFFTLIISASLTVILVQGIGRYYPLSMRRYELPFLLVGGNSAVIGFALQQNLADTGLLYSLLASVGASLGFALVLCGFASLRQRLDSSNAPAVFKGPALYTISAGLLAMGLRGFGAAP